MKMNQQRIAALQNELKEKNFRIQELESKIKDLDIEQEDHTLQLEMQHEINEALYTLFESMEDCEKAFEEFVQIDREKIEKVSLRYNNR